MSQSQGIKMQHGVPCGKSTEFGSIWERKTCPYNESHSVGVGSFASHQEKCRQACPPDVRDKYIVCPYNSSHHVLKEVYEEHLKVCPEYRQYEAEKFPMTPEMAGRMEASNWKTPRDIRIKKQQEDREKQMVAGAPERELTSVEGEVKYTDKEFDAFINQ